MDKEKMRDELAQDLRACCKHTDISCRDSDCNECRAEYLVSVGYCKIHEGEVVLTKEEYEKLKNKPPFALIKFDEEKMKEIAKETAKNFVLEFTKKGKDKIRKETARDIYFDYEKEIKAMHGAFDHIDAYSILESLKEVCEKHSADFNDGVEVE